MIEKIDEKRICQNCRFFSKETGRKGQCHRYPPQAWSESNPETSSSLGFNFPEIRNEEWCGEHQHQEVWILPKGWKIKNMPDGYGAVCEIQD